MNKPDNIDLSSWIFNESKTLNDLIASVEKNWGILGSSKFYTTDEISSLLESYINWTIPINMLTNSFWFRDKVIEILSNNTIETNILNSSDFSQLYSYLSQAVKIWEYKSDYIISVIDWFRSWKNDINFITRKYWLRNKVLLLRNQELLNIDISKTLWPYWLNSFTKQWEVWNCYFVSILNSIKNNPNWSIILQNMINIKSDWSYDVVFKWLNKVINITIDDINSMWKNRQFTYNLGDLILERAHARAINFIRWWDSWKTMFKNIYNSRLLYEWWYMDETLKLFYWDTIISWSIIKYWEDIFVSRNSSWFTKEDFDIVTMFINSLSDENIVTLYSNSNNSKSDSDYYYWFDYYWNNISLFFNHAYSVYDFDLKNWWVDIVNPHDSSFVFKVSINTLLNNFSWFSLWRFK